MDLSYHGSSYIDSRYLKKVFYTLDKQLSPRNEVTQCDASVIQETEKKNFINRYVVDIHNRSVKIFNEVEIMT